MIFHDSVYDDLFEGPMANPKDILNYPSDTQFVFDLSIYDEPCVYTQREDDKDTSDHLKAM